MSQPRWAFYSLTSLLICPKLTSGDRDMTFSLDYDVSELFVNSESMENVVTLAAINMLLNWMYKMPWWSY